MQCSSDVGAGINSFALVSYIPDPLGSFLNRLRSELIPGCVARSHVTILPPRELAVSSETASMELRQGVQPFRPFSLRVSDIHLFEVTSVIYLGISAGSQKLQEMHDALNRGGLRVDEPHIFHPHVTLAQNFDPSLVPELLATAKARWAEFRGQHQFDLDSLAFVQNTEENRWVDLEMLALGETVHSL